MTSTPTYTREDQYQRIGLIEEALEALVVAREALSNAGVLSDEYFRRTGFTHLQGEDYGWMGGPFLIDQVGELLAAALKEVQD